VEQVVAELTEGQHGVVACCQLVQHGLSSAGVEWLVREHSLRPFHPGVYHWRGAPFTERSALLAACLAVPGAVVSHRAAAGLWRLDGVAPAPPEITVVGRAPRLRGVVAHRTVALDPADVTVYDGIPVTTAARTVVDLGTVVSRFVVERAFDHARRRRITTVAKVRGAYERRARRRGTAAIGSLLRKRLAGCDLDDSDLEKRALRVLRRAGFPEPAQQHRVDTAEGTYFPDLAYPTEKVAIELYGFDSHGTRSAFDRDPLRANALQNEGWIVLIFTSAAPTPLFLAQVATARARSAVS
jgi:hypothetical protein